MVNKTSKVVRRDSSQDSFRHRSFRRSYREDYVKKLNVPGIGHHIYESFRMIFGNWRIFLPFLIIMVVVSAGVIGLVDLSAYKDTAIGVLIVLIFLVIWLTTIFVLRQRMADNKIGLRDALYNAMTPFLSSLVVLLLAVIQAVPVMLLLIAYSAAVETNFLAEPFYALLFLVFAGLMILITGYLWSGTVMALTAVSAPGLYPIDALKAANELMLGNRIKFVLRLIAVFLILSVIWVIFLWPLLALSAAPLVISVMITILSCFSVMYLATYFYLYYKWMLEET